MRSVLDSTVIRQGCACRGALGQPSCCSCAAHAPMGSVLDGNGLLNTAIGTGPSGCTCCSTYAWDHAARTQRTVVRQCDHAVLMRKLTKGEWGRRLSRSMQACLSAGFFQASELNYKVPPSVTAVCHVLYTLWKQLHLQHACLLSAMAANPRY
eukprot:1159393-Pelagomonas_calceolata.AAC.2